MFLEVHRLRRGDQMVANEACTHSKILIEPIPLLKVVGPYRSASSFYLFSLTARVEQDFGILAARLTIIQNILQISVYISSCVIFLCMKWRKFCIENGEQIMQRRRYEKREQNKMEMQEWYASCKEENLLQLWLLDDQGIRGVVVTNRSMVQMVGIRW